MEIKNSSSLYLNLLWVLVVVLLSTILSFFIKVDQDINIDPKYFTNQEVDIDPSYYVDPFKTKSIEPIEIIFILFFSYLTFVLVEQHNNSKKKKIEQTILESIILDIDNIDKKQKEILLHENDINLIFEKFTKFSRVILNELFKHNYNKQENSIIFHNLDEYQYSDLLSRLANITTKSYYAIMNSEATPDWFFINDDYKGRKQDFLIETNNLGQKILQVLDKNGAKRGKRNMKNLRVKRILVFKKVELINSFKKDFFTDDNFKLFLSWHSNIELIWIDPDEFKNIKLEPKVKEILTSTDFALFDNNIVLRYQEKELNLVSNIELYKQIFDNDCFLLNGIKKDVNAIKKLYAKCQETA